VGVSVTSACDAVGSGSSVPITAYGGAAAADSIPMEGEMHGHYGVRSTIAALAVLGVTVVTGCGDALATEPTRPPLQPDPNQGVYDSYAAAPCAPAIARDLAGFHDDLGDPTSVVATRDTAHATSYVTITWPVDAGYRPGGVPVYEQYYWRDGWDYCMLVRTPGFPRE